MVSLWNCTFGKSIVMHQLQGDETNRLTFSSHLYLILYMWSRFTESLCEAGEDVNTTPPLNSVKCYLWNKHLNSPNHLFLVHMIQKTSVYWNNCSIFLQISFCSFTRRPHCTSSCLKSELGKNSLLLKKKKEENVTEKSPAASSARTPIHTLLFGETWSSIFKI